MSLQTTLRGSIVFRRAVYVFLMSTSALLFTLNLTYSKQEMTKSDTIYRYYFHPPWTNFSFPEINETRVLQNEGQNVGRVQTVYFLTPRDLNDSENLSDMLAFQPVLSFEDRQAVLLVFQKFVRACSQYNVTFFLYGGTLLGSLRHHDIIPWDDDIDVMVNTSNRALLRHALLSVGKDFHLKSPENLRWKFFWTKPKTLPQNQFRWPYVDIFFYSENSSHICDQEFSATFCFSKRHVFPLCLRPLAGALLPAPHETTVVVDQNYSPSLCSSLRYSHKLEHLTPTRTWITIPCTRLYGLYPFVHTQTIHGRIHENLMLNSTLIETFIVPERCS
ncbi:fukutin-related protein [Biomphalaria pfeifferi]|uniref:Fukutin-related protein n=1 Tax=Biomphalaria pfeifferi TaxID=112525 RepID=A0AAD8AXM8_BIOPF|nr:fukutin-related protein [Biomphalaria pfeifferi]